jgi:hypothetical protein
MTANGLLTLQGLAGNAAVAHVALGGREGSRAGLQRVPETASPSAPPAGAASTSTGSAVEQLQRRWRIGTIRAGTLEEQADELLRYGRIPRTTARTEAMRLLQAGGWASWEPPPDHAVWPDLARAFDDIAARFGGAPPIDRLLFFRTQWRYEAAGPSGPQLQADATEGAYVSGETMVVYERGSLDQVSMPIAGRRSEEGPQGIQVSLTERGHVLTHELAHGLMQQFLSADPPGENRRFRRLIGWVTDSQLHDVGAPGVREAIDAGDQPDPASRITGDNWFLPRWREQPVSRYSVTHGPAEDMAETLAMFTRQPDVLAGRSPARHEWATSVMRALQAQPGGLRTAAPAGSGEAACAGSPPASP